MLCVNNTLAFRYALMDSWFAATENFEFIVKKHKHFIAALKDNRLVALGEADTHRAQVKSKVALSGSIGWN